MGRPTAVKSITSSVVEKHPIAMVVGSGFPRALEITDLEHRRRHRDGKE
jgi:hypothetical protein